MGTPATVNVVPVAVTLMLKMSCGAVPSFLTAKRTVEFWPTLAAGSTTVLPVHERNREPPATAE